MTQLILLNLGKVYLTGLLLVSIPFAPTASLWLLGFVIGVQGFIIYRQIQGTPQIMLTIISVLILPQIFAPFLGTIVSLFVVIPILALFDWQLKQLAGLFWPENLTSNFKFSKNLKAIILSFGCVFILGVITELPTLIGASCLLSSVIAVRLGWEYIFLQKHPITITSNTVRILAGTEKVSYLEINNPTQYSINFHVSSNDESLKIYQSTFTLESNSIAAIQTTITSQLSGQKRPSINLSLNGPWGLLSLEYSNIPLEIQVIPRARYAAWLAQKYLEGTGQGVDIRINEIPNPMRGKVRGVEFQQLREYQPGDRIREVDWHHSYKFRKLFVKERLEPPQGEVMIVLNTVAETPEEADWISYNLVMSCLSAVQQGLPTSIFAYNEVGPVLITNSLQPKIVIQKALNLASRVDRRDPIERNLTPPNVNRLRRMMRKIKITHETSSWDSLENFLLVELNAITLQARNHPVASTFEHYLNKANKDTTITLVSLWNHDSEILSITVPKFRNLGYQIIDLLSQKEPVWTY